MTVYNPCPPESERVWVVYSAAGKRVRTDPGPEFDLGTLAHGEWVRVECASNPNNERTNDA